MEDMFHLGSIVILPSSCCQAFFLLSAGFILGLQVLPAGLRKSLMDYGARRPKKGSSGRTETHGDDNEGGRLQKWTDALTALTQVPHSWFLHFYILSVASSLFWATQYLKRGTYMGYLARTQQRQQALDGTLGMDQGQVITAWLLMMLQGQRRLYESLRVARPGTSPMWAVHWILGLVFYATMGISVWIEGSSAILYTWETEGWQILTRWRATSAAALVAFFVCWTKQYQCHRHLASLKKYTLPDEGMFKYIICPHYTCECGIYLALAHVAAPMDSYFNRSVLCGFLFVAVNLGATASGTKSWYAQKFGQEKVASRWKMIPFLF